MLGNRHSNMLSKSRPARPAIVVIIGVLLVALLSLVAVTGPGEPATHAQAAAIPLGSVVATTTGLTLREQPAADGPSLAVMPVNARAVVLGGPFNDNWYWLDYNGIKGYVNGKYLAIVDENYTPVPIQTPTTAPVPRTTQAATQAAPSPVTTGSSASPTQQASGS